MTKNEQLQSLIQLYKTETGNISVDMDLVADWAIKKGAQLPKPKTAKELFVTQLSDAARNEYKIDEKTGYSYRVNHALRGQSRDGRQHTLWVGLDDATRNQMLTSLTNRRQQMVGDATQLKTDELVWNSRNKDQEPIQLVMDFTYDVEERLNAPNANAA